MESSDRRLLYLQGRQGQIWQMPLEGGTPQPTPAVLAIRPDRYLALAGNTLYFIREEQGFLELETLDLATQHVRKLGNIPGQLLLGTPGLAVDPKQHWLLLVRKQQQRSSIMLQER